jgi:hypothetical protein
LRERARERERKREFTKRWRWQIPNSSKPNVLVPLVLYTKLRPQHANVKSFHFSNKRQMLR